jgi:Tfp pilus assembly protein PilV
MGGQMSRTIEQSLRREDGSLLIEVLVTAMLLVVVAMGVLEALDRADARGAEQRAKAIAGNFAQAEQERLRSLPIEELSNLRSTTTRSYHGATYTIDSRSEWVTDATGQASCTASGAPADYMKITSTVSAPALRNRRPVTLASIISPPARAFSSSQGSLSVQIVDRDGNPAAGHALALTGPANVSGTTNALGCVLWGYLPAGNGYTVSFSSTGFVDTSSRPSVSAPATVVGEQTNNSVFSYDRGGRIDVTFATTRMSDSREVPSEPAGAMVENSAPPSTQLPHSVSGSTLRTQLLFPFAQPYAVYADRCTSARPAQPVSGAVGRGQTAPARGLLPSLDIQVLSGAIPADNASVRVRTPCGTTYARRTNTSGRLADPGFPWSSSLDVCVSDGGRRVQQTLANTTMPGRAVTIDLASATLGGPCS